MKRLLLAIVAGFIVTAVLSIATDHLFHVTGVYPPYGEPMFATGLLTLALSYRVIFTLIGSYITAMIAKENAMKAVTILGIIGSILWLAGAIAMWEYGPAWYSLGGAFTGIPLTLVGGKLYELRVKKVNPKATPRIKPKQKSKR